MKKELNFIFVNFNTSQLSINCVQSLLPNIPIINKIIVVDNNSQIDEWQILSEWIIKQNNTKISALRLDINIGYFKAINQGILELGNDVKNAFTIVGNNDMEFSDNFCEALINKSLKENIMVIAPNIINNDGFHQNPYYIKRMSKIKKLMLSIYYRNYYLSRIIYAIILYLNLSKRSKSNTIETDLEIYAGQGSCYILTNQFFSTNNNLLYTESFLFGEEIFLAKQVKELNGVILYCPDLHVIHKENGSISKVPTKYLFPFMKDSFKKTKRYM